LFFRAVTVSGAPRPVVSPTVWGVCASVLVIGVIAVST
jgi:hypothetical protein